MNYKDKLLILDLDETLIYASEIPLAAEPDFLVFEYSVYKRPDVDNFIATCLEWFDVAVWTSSGTEYAAAVVAAIFPDPQALKFVWANDRCSMAVNYSQDIIDGDIPPYYWRKQLKKVKRLGYKLESIIAIDDTPKKWESSYGNLIRVQPFVGDDDDVELISLLKYLDTLRHEPNIRKIEKRGWRERGKFGQ